MHNKLKEIQDQSQVIGEFLEWLTGPRGVSLSEYGEDQSPWDTTLQHVRQKPDELLAEYFGIDLKVLEQEKREMLKALRS